MVIGLIVGVLVCIGIFLYAYSNPFGSGETLKSNWIHLAFDFLLCVLMLASVIGVVGGIIAAFMCIGGLFSLP